MPLDSWFNFKQHQSTAETHTALRKCILLPGHLSRFLTVKYSRMMTAGVGTTNVRWFKNGGQTGRG